MEQPIQKPAPTAGPGPLLVEVRELRKAGDWKGAAALAPSIPRDFGASWVRVADEVAFALSNVHEREAAISLWVRAHELEPSRRFASAIAYAHYDALLADKVRKPRLVEPEPWRKGFERWITEALSLDPRSIKDRYRLGIYFGSIHNGKDVAALRAFRETIALVERLPETERTPGARFFKTLVLAHYGAARSAFRLGRYEEARGHVFRCIRLDQDKNHQKPVFKLFLAARVLVELGKLDDAERGLRLALDARHEGPRDFVFALLARISLMCSHPYGARCWIEQGIPAHHRKPYVCLLGDAARAEGDTQRAAKLYKSALLRDRASRHVTLRAMGRLFEETGEFVQAARAFREAAEFRRRQFLSEDTVALEDLARVSERAGDIAGARAAYGRLARLDACREEAERALGRLAG